MKGLRSEPVMALGALVLALSSAGCGDGEDDDAPRDLAHEALAAEDGWAAVGPGTTGGARATPEQTYVVRNRAELLAALNDGVTPVEPPPAMRGEPRPPQPAPPSSAPKIIVVEGTIDLNVDDANQPLSCEDYARNGYTPGSFDETYNLEVWGRNDVRGPAEEAREASSREQEERIRVRVGSNTTLVGRGMDARLRGVWLDIRGSEEAPVSNIIIRNLTLEDTFDCFPEWLPTEGERGSWSPQFDTISLRRVDHVWIDHNTFQNRETLDVLQEERLGVKYQTHSAQLLMRSASDLMTISYNRFVDHDRVMLIGSSDSATGDRGKLRVTLHHNLFRNTGQGTPRVRFGQVHLYNNLYEQQGNGGYSYSWGAGFESALYARSNVFATDSSLTPDRFIRSFQGTSLFEAGTIVDDGEPHEVDLVAAWNERNEPDLIRGVGWQPALWSTIEAASNVSATVSQGSGPLDW